MLWKRKCRYIVGDVQGSISFSLEELSKVNSQIHIKFEALIGSLNIPNASNIIAPTSVERAVTGGKRPSQLPAPNTPSQAPTASASSSNFPEVLVIMQMFDILQTFCYYRFKLSAKISLAVFHGEL